MCFHAFGRYFSLILDKTLQKPENLLWSYLQASDNWKQNRNTSTGLFFIAAFV